MDKEPRGEEENIFEVEELGFFVTIEHKDEKIIICGAECDSGHMLYKVIPEGFGTPSLFEGNTTSLFRFLRKGFTKTSEMAKSHFKWDDNEEGLFLCSTIKTEYFSRDFCIKLPFTKGQDINCVLAFSRLAERKHRDALKRIESIENPTCKSVPLELVGDWKEHGGIYAPPTVTKQGNLVMVSGMVSGGKDKHFVTLPEGYRPPHVLIFSLCASYKVVMRVDVYTNGSVILNHGTMIPSWVSLDGISFIAK